MSTLPLLLLTLSAAASASLSSSAPLSGSLSMDYEKFGMQHMLTDVFNCAQLRCEWRGEGKRCKSGNFLYQDHLGIYVDFLHPGDSEEDLLKRIKTRHSLNTFMILNKAADLGACKIKGLWCNVFQQHIADKAFEMFMEDVKNNVTTLNDEIFQAKLHC